MLLSVVYLSGEGLSLINLYNTLSSYLRPDFYLVSDFIAALSIPMVKSNSHKSKMFLEQYFYTWIGKGQIVCIPKTLAYVFDDCVEATRFLTPQRCAHFSDSELKLNKI